MLTEKEFADALRVTVRTVQNWINAGIILPGEVVRPAGTGRGKIVRIKQEAMLRLTGKTRSACVTRVFNCQQDAKLRQRLGL